MNLEAQLLQIIEQHQQQLKEQQKQLEQALQLIQAQNRTIEELEKYNNELVTHCNHLIEQGNELGNIIKQLQNPTLSADLLQNLENSLKQRLQSHLKQLVTGLNIEDLAKTIIEHILPLMVQDEIKSQLNPMTVQLIEKLSSVEQYQQNLADLTQQISSRL